MTGHLAGSRTGAVILQWPADALVRDDLHEQRIPRLLMMEAGDAPPAPYDELEDWIWLPANESDVYSRLRHLEARAARLAFPAGSVSVGEDGTAWVAGTTLSLPNAEAAILRVLAEPPHRLRSRDELQTAAWGDVPHRRRSLDSRIFVLRRRLAPTGVSISTVRGRGFVLTLDWPPAVI